MVAFASSGGGSTAHVINAHTGAVQASLPVDGATEQLLHLPQALHDNSADQHVYVAVPAGGGAARVLPDTQQAAAAFKAARPNLTFWRVDEAAGKLTGLGFSGARRWAWSGLQAGRRSRLVAC